jgi:hypothetical protein
VADTTRTARIVHTAAPLSVEIGRAECDTRHTRARAGDSRIRTRCRAVQLCCAYHPAGVALDFFIEYPALRSRLLGGVTPWKYNVEGFLYYQVAGWFCDKSNAHADTGKHCYNDSFVDENGGPRTAWKPYGAGGFPDGGGEILAPGIVAPLATVQVKNWRDGSEDYEYLTLLKQRIDAAQASGHTVPRARSRRCRCRLPC